MSITFNSADIAETMNNGVSNVTGADSTITENYTNVVQHGIKIDMSVSEKTLSGTPPLSFNSSGTPLLDFHISGNMVQNGTPTPNNPIQPSGCGDLETSGAKAGQYKIPISSANITTPVYLGEVQTTRAIRKHVFNGTEGWQRTSNGVYYLPSTSNPMSNYKYISADISINSHFPSQGMVTASSFVNDGKSAFFYIASSGTREYYIAARNIPTADDFKAYLAAQYAAGTPVTVWYVLAKPTTGIVNEPLRKIDNYADTLSMEQAGVTIPTASGSNTIDVDTALKPSSISITYKGR